MCTLLEIINGAISLVKPCLALHRHRARMGEGDQVWTVKLVHRGLSLCTCSSGSSRVKGANLIPISVCLTNGASHLVDGVYAGAFFLGPFSDSYGSYSSSSIVVLLRFAVSDSYKASELGFKKKNDVDFYEYHSYPTTASVQ